MQKHRTLLRAQANRVARLHLSGLGNRPVLPCLDEVITRLFRRLGYRVRHCPATHDQGVDLILARPGVRAIVQCKQWRHPVGPAVVRDLYGTLLHNGADLGVLVTTSTVSRSALHFAQGKPLLILDGALLQLLLAGLS